MTDSEKMDLILQEITGMKKDVADLKEDLAEVKRDVADLKEELAEVKKDVADLKEDMTEVKKDIADLKEELTEVKKEVKDTKVHIEHVTDNNIRIVAEGHTDLSRKLDDALKVNNEKELLLIRMSYLEDEVRRIKERLAQIA